MRDEAVPTFIMDWDPDRPAPGHLPAIFARTARTAHRVPTLCDNDELSMCSVAPNISRRPPDSKKKKDQQREEANTIPAKRFCCCCFSMAVPFPSVWGFGVSRALHPSQSGPTMRCPGCV